ncbi:LOW QUALITY PROTEIN: hypothetical protein V2J09_017946 [Rumex salicifolius]
MGKHGSQGPRLVKEEKARERDLIRREKAMWLQRAKANEFKLGSRPQEGNMVKKLVDKNGLECRAFKGKAKVVFDYFYSLFMSKARGDFALASHGIMPLLSKDDNDDLLAPFDPDKIKSALLSMHPIKSPGRDSMSALFYKKFWHIFGVDITNLVISVLNEAELLTNLNNTFISLIPKVNKPCMMNDLRPISLCNVLYKIIAKVLSNRLKMCLHKLVAESQSAFVSGRLIIDNVLAPFELFHYIKKKTKGRKGFLAL